MATLTVTNLNDSGAGSLRQALADAQAAAGADTVTFAGGLAGGTIRLTSGQLILASGAASIDGDLDNDGTADITISGDANDNGVADAGDSALMLVQGGATVDIDGLVFANGASFGSFPAAAGAIENLGALTIANSIFRDNFAKWGDYGGDAAGAILNAGMLTVADTAFENNRAEGGDGSSGEDGSSAFPMAMEGQTGGVGGGAAAGILNLASGTLAIASVTFRGGVAEGGNGGRGGNGSFTFSSYYGGNGGNGGIGGSASLGVINNGAISGDMLAYLGGSISGGLGGAGGYGGPGYADIDGYVGYGASGANGTPGATAIALLNLGTGSPEVTIFGTALADTFAGTAEVDRVFGLAGADAVAGLAGNDTLAGGDGNDVLDGGTGDDAMAGGLGNDQYLADDVGDTVSELAGQGNDTVNTTLLTYKLGANVERVNFIGTGNFIGIGNGLDNRFAGGAGNDRIVDALGGADIFSGGGGIDTVDFRSSTVAAIVNLRTNAHGGAAAGDRFVSIEKFLGSDGGADRMSGYGERVILAGFGGDDRLNGGARNDHLLGGEGDDRLNGKAGRDTLDGGAGDDVMTGGGEGDVFVFTNAGFGQDTIGDYQDGLDRFKVFSAIADDISDFIITGNGTTSVMLALGAGNTITINGAAAITIAADDFVFY